MSVHFPHELVAPWSAPMQWLFGVRNAPIPPRLLMQASLWRALEVCLAWAQRPHVAPWVAAAVLSLLTMTGCAGVPDGSQERAAAEPTNDPAEPVNRAIFKVNQFADHHVLRPVAEAYKDYVSGGVQRGIHNFVGNLGQPEVALNDVLQCNFRRAGTTTLRFGVNTTAGVGGVLDVATGWKLPAHEADFGQTFGVWGVGPGPFVELPLFGPSNVRDTVGKAVGAVADPFGSTAGVASLTTIGYARSGLGLLGGRAEAMDVTDPLEKQSLDYYATLRSVSVQRRKDLVAEGKNPDTHTSSTPRPDPNPLAPAIP
ncbi:MAG TPA: VacJ family lipoprotein [Stellaceae bacterium]|nr:VacJ family lipoprotein [Stellaceae bacterium]